MHSRCWTDTSAGFPFPGEPPGLDVGLPRGRGLGAPWPPKGTDKSPSVSASGAGPARPGSHSDRGDPEGQRHIPAAPLHAPVQSDV